MARFVLDASATLAWCFEDEATAWTDALLVRLKSDDEALVPAHWSLEVVNGLLMAMRRRRITKEQAARFFENLLALPIRIDSSGVEHAFGRVFLLAEEAG